MLTFSSTLYWQCVLEEGVGSVLILKILPQLKIFRSRRIRNYQILSYIKHCNLTGTLLKRRPNQVLQQLIRTGCWVTSKIQTSLNSVP